jgi:uncharacterized membrane protein
VDYPCPAGSDLLAGLAVDIPVERQQEPALRRLEGPVMGRRLVAAVVCCLAGFGSLAAQAPGASLVDLGLLHPFDLTDEGWIAGRLVDSPAAMPIAYPAAATTWEYTTGRAALWANGVPFDLGLGDGSAAFGLNRRGRVVGVARGLPPPGGITCNSGWCLDGVVLDDGVRTDLTGTGTASGAHAVSDRGDVVGWWTDKVPTPSAPLPAMSSALWARDLQEPPLRLEGASNFTYGIEIDGRGKRIVAGALFYWDAYPRCYLTRENKDDGAWSLEYIGDESVPCIFVATNAKGRVVGASGSNPAAAQAFAYQDGVTTPLPGPLPSLARDISERGVIVGKAGGRAAIWIAGAYRDLNDFVAGAQGFVLLEAWKINGRRQVIGLAERDGERRGFLLTLPAHLDGMDH